jgi:hypothetical protein
MAKKPRYEKWWCIQSPQYGLLPFTAHTLRIGSIGLFETHGLSPMRKAHAFQDRRYMKTWASSKRLGYRCLRISVRAV